MSSSHGETIHIPTIALSSRSRAGRDRLDWIVAHGFALEYTPDPTALDRLPAILDPFLNKGLRVRYHGFFPENEFGHQDPALAEDALHVQMAMLEAIRGRGEPVITVHIGLDPRTPLDAGRAVENLTRLTARGRELGITVCLENLRRGPTSDPETVAGWAQAAGAMITLDIGHAFSSRHVQDHELTVLDYLRVFESRLMEVHLYERESDRHYPPHDMSILGPVVDRLLQTDCIWWTIELDDYSEALATRTLVNDYLAGKGVESSGQVSQGE